MEDQLLFFFIVDTFVWTGVIYVQFLHKQSIN